jgi:predicted esterase
MRGEGKEGGALVVGLHGHGGTPWSMCKALGNGHIPDDTVVVCPYGYGDLAFRYAGRRDLFEVLRRVSGRFAIDPSRVSLVGVSDGGLAAYEVGLDHPEVFGVVAALAAAGDMRVFPAIGRSGHAPWEAAWLDAVSAIERAPAGSPRTRWLLVYGGRDRFPDAARAMAGALRKSGAEVELRILADNGHDVWSETFAGGGIFDWIATAQRGGQSPTGGAGSHDAERVCAPGPESLDRVRDRAMVHVYATGDPANAALYRYLAELDSARWGRRVFLDRAVVSDEAARKDPAVMKDRSLVLVGPPAAHASQFPDGVAGMLEARSEDEGLRALLRPPGMSLGCPGLVVVATGKGPRAVTFVSHLPEILPAAVAGDAAAALPPFGLIRGDRRRLSAVPYAR